MPLFPNHKLVFIHIPKSAGSSIYSVFASHGDPPIFTGTERQYNGHSPQHSTYDELKQCGLIPDGWKVFTVIRNPYSRFLSEFNSRPGFIKAIKFASLFYNPLYEDIWDNHDKPANYFIQVNNVTILRYENLASDFMAFTGYELDAMENVSPRKINKLPDEVKFIVASKWEEDFGAFNYESGYEIYNEQDIALKET